MRSLETETGTEAGASTRRLVSLTTVDGLRLHVEQILPVSAPRVDVVLVHGFSVHAGRYGVLAEALPARGAALTLVDCRGHGRSDGRRGHVPRFECFREDLFAVLAATESGRPQVLLGHSHGALVALDFVLANRRPVAGLILAAPFLRLRMAVPRWKVAACRALQRIWPTLTVPNGLDARLSSRNEALREEVDPLVHDRASVRWYSEVLHAQERVRAEAARLRTPTLLLLPGEDLIVDGAAAVELARAAGPAVETVEYPGLYHEIFLEPERQRVADDVAAWLSRRFG
jgi:lysophospholipase